jgi:hypothetical protein
MKLKDLNPRPAVGVVQAIAVPQAVVNATEQNPRSWPRLNHN